MKLMKYHSSISTHWLCADFRGIKQILLFFSHPRSLVPLLYEYCDSEVNWK